jgi:uncharacterized protein
MRPSTVLNARRDLVQRLANARGASNLRVFGSVLAGTDADGSDVDLLVDVARGTSLIDLAQLQLELEALLGCGVDVHTTRDLPESIRAKVLESARPL